MLKDTFFLLLLTALAIVQAHPGEHHDHTEITTSLAKRAIHGTQIARGLARCGENRSFVELQRRGIKRRHAKVQEMRLARGISTTAKYRTRRDSTAFKKFEALSHNMTSSNITYFTSPSNLFGIYSNASCILTPEVTEGPYFVQGEHVRSDVIESQAGVPVHLEYQYIDISTCSAAHGLWVDTWQANATGVYSGVTANGNGDTDDTTNLDATFLRGIQPTDYEGVAAFDTIIPGHYTGRTNHIHLMAHQNGTYIKNGTYVNSYTSHVGQVFFPTDLINAVEAIYPYSANTQTVTTNDEDSIAQEEADNNYDPFPSFAYLGDSVTDGLLMWIQVGIDMSANYTVSPAAYLTPSGGVANSNSGFGGGGPGGNGTIGGDGTMSGSPPSGS